MTNERIIPTPASSDLPTCTIKCNGTAISGTYYLITAFVLFEINRIPQAKIVLFDGDAAKEDFELSNSDEFIPGTEIEILAGYHSDEQTIFKGIIIKHAIKVRRDNSSMLELDLRDTAVKLTLGRKNAVYLDSTDSDIIETILGNNSVSEKDVESSDVQHKEMVQYNVTDWDFMITRAEANSKLVFVENGKVTVKTPTMDDDPVLTLLYGATILEFEAEMDARDQVSAVKANSWDYANQQVIIGDGAEPSVNDQGNVTSSDLSGVIGLESFDMYHSGKVKDDELAAWASAKMLKSRLAKIRGRVKCQGFADVVPGKLVELKGVGERFNGKAFVSGVRHQITSENWETDIQFGMSPEWFNKLDKEITEIPASGLIPFINGLHIGIVSQLGDDPDSEYRVKVKIPLISSDDGIWARYAAPDAGNTRGVCFKPEIDDEVVVGFLNDDPRDPVILGCLHSSAKPAPIEGSDDNHEKGIFTRSEMKVVFNDDKKSILISTPAGNSVSLSEEDKKISILDQNNNKIEMSSDGIIVESCKDLSIKASGDIKMEGNNITISAKAQFKSEGSSGAELSTSAQAVIKGSLVKIN